MAPILLKVARIGNSRGVRIPAPTLERFRIGDSVVMEERADGILLRPMRIAGQTLSWADTARAMATEVRVAGKRAEIAVDQIRTISTARLGRKLGALSVSDARNLRRLITEMYGK